MGKDKISFTGFDWGELGPVLGLDYDKYSTDKAAHRAFVKALINAANRHDGHGDSEVAAGVRRYLSAMEKVSGYLSPFCRGLRSIEHDGVMLRLVAHNLGDLWT